MRTSIFTLLGCKSSLFILNHKLTPPKVAISVLAVGPPTPDPSGAKNVGNGKGQQFITGQCISSADCASTCCAGPAGICSGIGAQFQAGKTGCGFGDAANGSAAAGKCFSSHLFLSDRGASAMRRMKWTRLILLFVAGETATLVSVSTTSTAAAIAATIIPDAAGSENVGKGDGSQFITGQCLSNADCASTCCAGPKGVCSAVLVANENGKTGCGFVSTKRLVRF